MPLINAAPPDGDRSPEAVAKAFLDRLIERTAEVGYHAALSESGVPIIFAHAVRLENPDRDAEFRVAEDLLAHKLAGELVRLSLDEATPVRERVSILKQLTKQRPPAAWGVKVAATDASRFRPVLRTERPVTGDEEPKQVAAAARPPRWTDGNVRLSASDASPNGVASVQTASGQAASADTPIVAGPKAATIGLDAANHTIPSRTLSRRPRGRPSSRRTERRAAKKASRRRRAKA